MPQVTRKVGRMAEKGSQTGRLSRTEREMDSLVRQVPRPTEASSRMPLRKDSSRVLYILVCIAIDAVLVPWLLLIFVAWMWVIVTPVVLVPLVYGQYRAHRSLFPHAPQPHHTPSDHIPQFRAADTNDDQGSGGKKVE